jgi:hypothetical protein
MTTNKADEQKSTVRGLFAQEEESTRSNPSKPKPSEAPKRPPKKKTPTTEESTGAAVEEKPKFLTTKQAARGILHCEIGPELYERAALFAYDPQAPVKDMTDLARKAITALLNEEEPLLVKLKAFQEKARRS